MNDFNSLVKFLSDNCNSIKNFDIQLSGSEMLDLLKLLNFSDEAAKFFAGQEVVKGTPEAKEEFVRYSKLANSFVITIGLYLQNLVSSAEAETLKH